MREELRLGRSTALEDPAALGVRLTEAHGEVVVARVEPAL
jgi:hypothetical protein